MMEDKSAVINTLRSVSLTENNLDCNGEELGRGAYGKVFAVKYCGQNFAAKEIHPILVEGVGKMERERLVKSFLQECYYCFNLRHPNIVQFVGVYWPQGQSDLPVMVMEMMDRSLAKFITNTDIKRSIKLIDKYSILHDVTLGLSFLHAQNPPVIHRDLSPNNILLTHKGVAKIGDLGVARAIQAGGKAIKKKVALTKAPGTAHFMPPEALNDDPEYDSSLDVFSFGGVVLFVMTEQWPTATEPTKLDPKTQRIVGFTEVERRRQYLSKMDEISRGLRLLVECCLDNDPSKRPDIKMVSEKIESFKNKLTTPEVSICRCLSYSS